ncbi:hypothetical protein [Rhizobium leguminosarum]|uniref:hypothetical protein n=1 Tax=Rhizobium leguminosarum TaxID=384 RepID=UPI00155848FF|nr:hypothetical protein [Rhizobium leguminosarum]
MKHASEEGLIAFRIRLQKNALKVVRRAPNIVSMPERRIGLHGMIVAFAAEY